MDVQERELAPAYWLGPIYSVRRGSWFYQEGSSLRPCDENLAIQLEQGYLRLTPWRYVQPAPQSDKKSKPRPVSMTRAVGGSPDGSAQSAPVKKISLDDLQGSSKEEESDTQPAAARFQLQTQRLFGQYMNSVVTYQDANVAWILTDDLLSRMSSSVYQRFAGGGHLGGVKVVRGFTEASKAKDSKPQKEASPGKLDPESAMDKPERTRRASPRPEDDVNLDKDKDNADSDEVSYFGASIPMF